MTISLAFANKSIYLYATYKAMIVAIDIYSQYAMQRLYIYYNNYSLCTTGETEAYVLNQEGMLNWAHIKQ